MVIIFQRRKHHMKTNTILSYHQLKKYNPIIILDFYEPRLHVYTKQIQSEVPDAHIKIQQQKYDQQIYRQVQNLYESNMNGVKQLQENQYDEQKQRKKNELQRIEIQKIGLNNQHQDVKIKQNNSEHNYKQEENKLESIDLRQNNLKQNQENKLQTLFIFQNHNNQIIKDFQINQPKEQTIILNNHYISENYMQNTPNIPLKQQKLKNQKYKNIKCKKNTKKKEKNLKQKRISKQSNDLKSMEQNVMIIKKLQCQQKIINSKSNVLQMQHFYKQNQIIPQQYILNYDQWKNRPNIINCYIKKRNENKRIVIPENIIITQPAQQKNLNFRMTSQGSQKIENSKRDYHKYVQEQAKSSQKNQFLVNKILQSSEKNLHKKKRKYTPSKQIKTNIPSKQKINNNLDKSQLNKSLKIVQKRRSTSKTKPISKQSRGDQNHEKTPLIPIRKSQRIKNRLRK